MIIWAMGETAKGEEELGHFPKAKGSETVVDDLYKGNEVDPCKISENTVFPSGA